MSKEERLSAVAKRRRLNGQSSPGLLSPAVQSRSHSPTKTTISLRNEVERSCTPEISRNLQDDSNSFATLVKKDVVQFSNFREVEKLSNGGVKVRLSKGQKCLVIGRFSLWVKDGTVHYLGAQLEASMNQYHVYVASSTETPAIQGLTNVAEVEINSIFDDAPIWTDFRTYHWTTLLNEEDVMSTSYFIRGYSRQSNGAELPATKEFDTTETHNVARRLGRIEIAQEAETELTVLISGLHSAGSNTNLTALLNSLLTMTKTSRDLRFPHGILLLDLDSERPTFGLPKTQSLIHFAQPILALPFFSPPLGTSDNSPQLIIRDYVGQMEEKYPHGTQQQSRFLKLVKELRLQRYQSCPLLIKADERLSYLELSDSQQLVKSLSPNSVVCFGTESNFIRSILGNLITTYLKDAMLLNVSTKNSRDLPLYTQNALLLQSYFHFRSYQNGRPTWSSLALEMDPSVVVRLKYGNSCRCSIASPILHGSPSIGADDLTDALDGCMVAILVRKASMVSASTELTHPGDQPGPGGIHPGNFVGLGIVAGFNDGRHEICLLTPIPQYVLDHHVQNGEQIDMIAQEVGADGNLDTAWVQLQLDASPSDRAPAKSIYRRKLNIA